jgi:hypothetical protein
MGKNVSILVPQPMAAAHDGYLAAYAASGVEVLQCTVHTVTQDVLGVGPCC